MEARVWIAVGLAASLCCAVVDPVFAEDAPPQTDVARAEAFAADAFDAYARKDYGAAVALYHKALEASPSADILYNIARIYDTKLKDRKRAIDYYRRYSLDTGADPERLRIANQRLAELNQLEAVAAEAHAPAPKAAAQANSGVQPVPTLPPSAAAKDPGLSGLQLAGIVTTAVGVAGIGVGVAFGLVAKNKADEAAQVCDGNACSTQGGVDASREASDAATVATAAWIAGGALALLGVTALLLGSDGGSERETQTASIKPYAGPGNFGTQITTRW